MTQDISFPDAKFLVLVLAAFLILTFEQVVAPTLTPTWYSVDNTVAVLILFFILFTQIPESMYAYWKVRTAITQYNIYGTMNNPLASKFSEGDPRRLQVTIAFALAVAALVGCVGLIHGIFPNLDLSIILPEFTASIATTAYGTFVSSDFIVAFVQPILEETLRAGILDKTIAGWVTTYLGIGIGTILLGVTITALLFNYAAFIGVALIIIGVVFMWLTRKKDTVSASAGLLQNQVGIAMAAIFLAGLHGFVLSGTSGVGFQNSILVLIGFFAGLSELDYILKSAVPSIIVHSVYNAVVYAAGRIVYIITGLAISALLTGIIYFLYPLGGNRRR